MMHSRTPTTRDASLGGARWIPFALALGTVIAFHPGLARAGDMGETLKGAAKVGAGTAVNEAAGGADYGTAGKKGASAAMDHALGTEQVPGMPTAEDAKAAGSRAVQGAADDAVEKANEKSAEAIGGGMRDAAGALGGLGGSGK